MQIPVKKPEEYSTQETDTIAAQAAAIMLRSKGQTVPLEDVQIIVQNLAIVRAKEFANIAAKPVKVVKTKAPVNVKAKLLAQIAAASGVELPAPAKPKRPPTKAAKMKLFFRKAQGETLTLEEEEILSTLAATPI